jgi:hypothetical protein
VTAQVVPSGTLAVTGLPALQESVTQSFVDVGTFESSGTEDGFPLVHTTCWQLP